MKLYVYDMYWKGAVVVLANSKEEALAQTIGNYTDDCNMELSADCFEEHEITPGLVVETLGDR